MHDFSSHRGRTTAAGFDGVAEVDGVADFDPWWPEPGFFVCLALAVGSGIGPPPALTVATGSATARAVTAVARSAT